MNKIGNNQYKKKRNFKKWIFIVLLISIGVYSLIRLGGVINPIMIYTKQEVVLDNLIGKINELKGSLVDEIKKCESAGYSEDYGLITFDPHKTNKKVEMASIGSYQFKKATVIFYYKSLYNKDITGREAILIALDDLKAGELATDIIFKTDNGLSNWLNCSKKYNSKNKLELINSLLK